MNQEQVYSGARWAISFAGGVAVGRGWLSADTLQAFLSNPEAIGLVVSVVMGGWGLLSRSTKNLQIAAANTGAKVITTPEISFATPNNPNVVSSISELPADTPKTPAAALMQAEEKKP